MKHPLENSSLAPIGFVFPEYKKRVFQKLGEGVINGDYYAARFFEGRNRTGSKKPLPVVDIIHRVMPSMSTRGETRVGDFESGGNIYLSRDIMIISTFMQWFGTSCGNCFIEGAPFRVSWDHPLREFLVKYAHENVNDRMIVRIVHECNSNCDRWCCYDADQVTERDRLVARALMYWLGTKNGRAYMSDRKVWMERVYRRYRRRALKKVRGAA